MVRLGDLEPVRHVLGRLQCAAMEMIVGGQRLEGRVRRIEPVLAQPRLEPLEQITARVVAGNLGRCGHWGTRSACSRAGRTLNEPVAYGTTHDLSEAVTPTAKSRTQKPEEW